MSDYERLLTWFSSPERYVTIDPRRAPWLSEENIRNLAKDERFMASFRQRHGDT